jgi:hypothetical protein
MEVFIRKGEKLLLRKFIGKGSSDLKRNEIVRLENEVVVFEIWSCIWNHQDHPRTTNPS